MATRSPALQERNQYHRHWGNFTDGGLTTPANGNLPNQTAAPLAAPEFTKLEVGDLAYVTSVDRGLYYCSDVGTVGAGDASWLLGAGVDSLTEGRRPTATDDSSAGYSIGSRWLDIRRGNGYVCLDAAVGDAVWKATNVEQIFFQRFPTVLDFFDGPAASFGGSNDFISATWLRPEDIAQYDGFSNQYNIMANGGGASGFALGWDFGGIRAVVADGSGIMFGPNNFGGADLWGASELRDKEQDVLAVMRVTGGAGTALLRVYLNARATSTVGYTASNPGITPSAGALRLAGGTGLYMTESVAYLDGTLTDAQLFAWMEACIEAGGIVAGAVSWDVYVNAMLPPGANVAGRWDDQSGNGNHFTASGAPEETSRRRRMAGFDRT